MLNLGELQQAIPGSVLCGRREVSFSSVSVDTRTLLPGALFFALRGERCDGHDFLADAVAQGAVALVVERASASHAPQLVVPDAQVALGQAAQYWRRRFALPLICVTGSNGKTTVTQMIASILAAAYGETGRLATRYNLNNAIGVPLTLFGLNPSHRAAVIELGMNHRGEIAHLAAMAQPTVALVNNAQREHQEFMVTVRATAEENGSVIAALPPDGVAVFPADDAYTPLWRSLVGQRKVMDFALHGPAAVTGRYAPRPEGAWLELDTPVGAIELLLPVAGEHNIRNALAAAATALAMDTPQAAIKAGLEAFAPVAGRGVQRRAPGGALVIDDSYNANPDSVRAAIDLLAQYPGTRILILGDMAEVGPQGPEFHREVGEYARFRNIDFLLAMGEQCEATVAAFNMDRAVGAAHFTEINSLLDAALAKAKPDSVLLVKGSRFMRMERVVLALTEFEY